MANLFAPGDRARVKLSGLGLSSGSVNPQPPLVGVVQKIDSPAPDAVTVLMEDGRLLQVDSYTFLDKITPTPSVIANTLLDKVVNGIAVPATATTAAVPYSDEYIGRVGDVYDVNLTTKALIRSLSNGMYYELAALSEVFVLEDR
jgi:hypothetical protein